MPAHRQTQAATQQAKYPKEQLAQMAAHIKFRSKATTRMGQRRMPIHMDTALDMEDAVAVIVRKDYCQNSTEAIQKNDSNALTFFPTLLS
jgi:hypothetical protein